METDATIKPAPVTPIHGEAGVATSAPCSPLGKLHKWWLREFGQHAKLMVDYGYAGTPYAKALIGLMNRGLIKFVADFEGAGLVELTPEGIKAKKSLANSTPVP